MRPFVRMAELIAVSLVLAVVLVPESSTAFSRAGPAPAGKPKPGTGVFRPQPGRYYLTDAEILQVRKNVATKTWARVAWAQTKAAADAALHDTPNPAPAQGDYLSDGGDSNHQCTSNPPTGWRCVLYARGLRDGRDALNLARAYAVTRKRVYGYKAKQFLLAWARTYNPPNPRVGHAIAEPAGFMLKAFLAYDLVRPVFGPRERREFRVWAKLFVTVGERRADYLRDHPGIPDQTYGSDTSNWQSFGNSAAFSRALAIAAAAAAGELKRALAWNWAHVTAGGRDNGWAAAIDGEIIDGTGGETFEGRARNDIGYALLGSNALLLIAHIARHAGFEPNLFTYTTSHGNTVLSPFLFYGPYLEFRTQWPVSDGAYVRRDNVASEFRADLEWVPADLPSAIASALRRIRDYGGASVRGANFDPRIGLYNALSAVR